MNWEKIVEERVKKEMEANRDRLLSHDFDHVKRVQKIALHIAEHEGGDREIVSIASLLHDIVTKRTNSMGKLLPPGVHARTCAERADKILMDLGYPDEKRIKVVKIITEHEWSQDIDRDLESQILYEADKLDGVGYFGALRHSYAAGEIGIPLIENIRHHLSALEEIRKRYRTETGKKMYESMLGPHLEIFKKALEEVNAL